MNDSISDEIIEKKEDENIELYNETLIKRAKQFLKEHLIHIVVYYIYYSMIQIKYLEKM